MNYPKPDNGSKRGIHWTASNYPASGDYWWHLDWMKRAGIGWVKYVADGNASSGQGDSGVQFGVECLKRGMIPIQRFYQPADHRWTNANDNAVMACVRNGIYYIEPMNEPDLKEEWSTGALPVNWLETCFHNWIGQAQRIIGHGGIPLSPAMASGCFHDRGQGSGTVRVNPFIWVKQAGITDFVCAIHNYTGNHPIDYPYDAVNQMGKPLTVEEYNRYMWDAWQGRPIEDINAQRARDKNPGATIHDDDSCFLAALVFRELLDEAGFEHVPIMTTEGGPVHTDSWEGRYPRVVPGLFEEMLEAELRWMADKPWYYCLCPWLWANNAAGGTGGWADCQWFHPGHPWTDSDGFMPVVKWLISRPVSEDGNTATPEPEPIPEPEPPEEEEPLPEPEVVNDAAQYGVVVVPAPVDPGETYWKITRIHHLTPDENNGNHNLFVNVLRDGQPYRESDVIASWSNDGLASIPLEKPWPAEPMGNLPMYRGQIVSAFVEDVYDSDTVKGVHIEHPDEPPAIPGGNLGNTNGHHSFLVEWQLVTKAGDVEPEPPPIPDDPTEQDIRNAAWNRAYPLGGIALNHEAALQAYARANGMGCPVTDEFDAGPYRVQGYALGIIYCEVGDWNNIVVIEW